MSRRNLANRADIPADVLRQRRDLYSLAIGLELFNLASGSLVSNTTFGTLMPVTLSHPEFLLYAAWVGFLYFWFRFWLISEARPFGDYLEDVKWQAENLRAVRRIAARHVHPHQHRPREMLEAWLLEPKGYIPGLRLDGARVVLDLKELLKRSNRGLVNPAGAQFFGDERTVVSGKSRQLWPSLGFARFP